MIAVGMHFIDGWWLDEGSRVRNMLLVLGVAAVVVCASANRPRLRAGLELWGGFMVGTTFVLGALGFGNIFPIVIFVGAVMSSVTVAVGWKAGLVFARVIGDEGVGDL